MWSFTVVCRGKETKAEEQITRLAIAREEVTRVLEEPADAGRPLRAGEFGAAAGLPTEKAKVEGLRSRLKLLAARAGWTRRRAACSRWRITQGRH
jgi:hypothetical protein